MTPNIPHIHKSSIRLAIVWSSQVPRYFEDIGYAFDKQFWLVVFRSVGIYP